MGIYRTRTHLEHVGMRLDRFVSQWLTGLLGESISRTQAKKWIDQGHVKLNGRRVKIASKKLFAHVRVEVHLDLKAWRAQQNRPLWTLTPDRILYEDEVLIAVDKPPDLPTQATRDERIDHLYAAVQRFLNQRQGREVYLGMHHRLDRQTSGIVLFSKSKRINADLSLMFKDHRFEKLYWAWSTGKAQPLFWTIEGALKRKGKKGLQDDGRWAQTHFKILESIEELHWIQAQPITGRRHQIRLHLYFSQRPILGDQHYGMHHRIWKGIEIPRLMLHAHALNFKHPLSQKRIQIRAPMPADISKFWNLLKMSVQSMRS